jgi:AcrR family transcriptional regulator
VEFAEKGFKRASTNAIVRQAGIGKGMLFYYFGSKEELFDFLCEYTLEFARNKYIGTFNAEVAGVGDFFERYRILVKKKYNAMQEHPELITFFESFYLPENADYFYKYAEGMAEIRDRTDHDIYGNLDESLFRDDLDPKAAIIYIKWILRGYELDLTSRFKSGTLNLEDNRVLQEEFRKFYSFWDDLRRIFYKRSEKTMDPAGSKASAGSTESEKSAESKASAGSTGSEKSAESKAPSVPMKPEKSGSQRNPRSP